MSAAAAPDVLPARRFWPRARPWLLLLPAFALMAYAFVLPIGAFLEYSVYSFERGRLVEDFTFRTYIRFLTDPYYHAVILDTLKMAAITTAVSLGIGYPMAYGLWRVGNPVLQRWFALIIFSPILVSVVVRSYGWSVLLSDQGAVNWVLTRSGLADKPVELVYNLTGVVISLSHVFLPFVVFPIFATMTRIDPALREASMDLGAGWWTTFRRVIFPQTLPGLVAAAQISFTLALGALVTPAILGGGRVLVLSLQVYRATSEINWPVASVGGLALLLMALVTVALCNRLLAYSET
jgi:putative spermidine/putrescine transport system permease protein